MILRCEKRHLRAKSQYGWYFQYHLSWRSLWSNWYHRRMKYVSTGDFMHDLFGGPISRRTIVDRLFGHSDIAAIASEHGVDRSALLEVLGSDESSSAGERLRLAVSRMRSVEGAPRGNAFPERLEHVTDGALELIGLFVNPLVTTSMILRTTPPPLEDAARAIDPRLGLATYASRVFRVLAVQHPPLATPLTNAANALESA